MTKWLISYLFIFLLSGLITYLVTFLTKIISKPLKIIDKPSPLKIHSQPTSRLGGIGIYIGFAVPIIFILYGLLAVPWINLSSQTDQKFLSILLGGCIIMLVGLYDDIKSAQSGGITAVIKLIILFVITFILAQGGIILNFPVPYVFNFILTLFWIIGVISAFNAMDNMDGLATGLAVIAAAAYTVIAYQTYQFPWGILATCLMGATAGFLPHNFRIKKPAVIFMGDAGSFFIGFTLAALSIMGGWSTSPLKAAIIPVIILGIPILDLIYIVIYRYRKGLTKNIPQIINYTGHDHFSHRINHFLSRTKTVLFIYFVSFTLGLGAIAIRNTSRWEAILIFIQYLLVFIIILMLIGFISKPKK